MAKPLPAAAWIERSHAKGFTYRQIAEGLNRSVSTVARIRRGLVSGESVRPAAKQLSARKAPPPLAHVVPVPAAPAPRPAPAPRVQRVTVSPTQRAVVQQGDPNREVLLREATAAGAQKVQVFVQLGDGHSFRLFRHGGWQADQLLAAMEADPDWLTNYLAGMKQARYKLDEHGGIAATQIVTL
jgi:transcriptional regulator with XRE-family HTH domain